MAIYTKFLNWIFPLKQDNMSVSYDMFSQGMKQIDKDLGISLQGIFGSNIKYRWESEIDRDATTSQYPGDLGFLISDRSIYTWESAGYWNKVATISGLSLVMDRKPDENDYKYNKGQFWVDRANGNGWYIIDNAQYDALWKSFEGELSGKNIREGYLYLDKPIEGVEVKNVKFSDITKIDGKFLYRDAITFTLQLGEISLATITPTDVDRYFLLNSLEFNSEIEKKRFAYLVYLTLFDLDVRYKFKESKALKEVVTYFKDSGFTEINLKSFSENEDNFNEYVTKVLEQNDIFKERELLNFSDFIENYNLNILNDRTISF